MTGSSAYSDQVVASADADSDETWTTWGLIAKHKVMAAAGA
jgi:hypothetical protein